MIKKRRVNKMKKNISIENQYDGKTEVYSNNIQDYNKESRELFFCMLPNIRGKEILDVGCGDGSDANTYAKLGANVTAIDASEEMISKARNKYSNVLFLKSKMEELPKTKKFDVVISKYAIQTSKYIDKVYSGVSDVLKPGGEFVFLVTHPIRQFLEKNSVKKDYFKKEIVVSTIFEDKITLHEPSHKLADYLSPYFLANFELLDFFEKEEFPAAKRMDGHNYPCYLIIRARKRGEKK
ncbi:MAG: class I SAM-dependent methyltransferase [Candidatus Woesearchaeota archaeon]